MFLRSVKNHFHVYNNILPCAVSFQWISHLLVLELAHGVRGPKVPVGNCIHVCKITPFIA